MPVPFVLASQSPARLATLRSAGIEPRVIVSHVDEDALLAAVGPASPADAVLTLARAKAEVVAGTNTTGALVLGCDSMLEFGGDILGKPGDAAIARARWRAMRGNSGTLHTGHWLVDARGDAATNRATGATSSTVVHFADLTDSEIDAYVATGEPLQVAGAFTVDGLGGPYVESIEGDYHGVVGVSLPLLRRLLAELGVRFTSSAPLRLCRRATTYGTVTTRSRRIRCCFPTIAPPSRSTASQTCSPRTGAIVEDKTQALPLPSDCLRLCAHRQPRRDRSSYHSRM